MSWDDISHFEMLMFLGCRPTALRIAVSNFLNSERLAHVVGVYGENSGIALTPPRLYFGMHTDCMAEARIGLFTVFSLSCAWNWSSSSTWPCLAPC